MVSAGGPAAGKDGGVGVGAFRERAGGPEEGFLTLVWVLEGLPKTNMLVFGVGAAGERAGGPAKDKDVGLGVGTAAVCVDGPEAVDVGVGASTVLLLTLGRPRSGKVWLVLMLPKSGRVVLALPKSGRVWLALVLPKSGRVLLWALPWRRCWDDDVGVGVVKDVEVGVGAVGGPAKDEDVGVGVGAAGERPGGPAKDEDVGVGVGVVGELAGWPEKDVDVGEGVRAAAEHVGCALVGH